MNKCLDWRTVILGLCAGLAGGLVSSQFLSGQPVFAQKKPPYETVVRSELFELVDQEGNLRGSLAAANGFVTVKLMGKRSSFLNISLGKTAARMELGTYTHGKMNVVVDEEGLQLELFDRLQPPRVKAVLGSVKLQDEKTGSIENREASSLVLFDETGKVVWKTP